MTLLKLKEVAKYLQLHYVTVLKMAESGKMPAFKVKGSWRVPKEKLDEVFVRKDS
jgi:excisionase family DNA binding protein